VSFAKADGKPAELKFRLDGARFRRFAGGAEIQTMPQADIDAKLVVEFDAADSFYIDAYLNVEEMGDRARLHHPADAMSGDRR
jgi:hypothetical protein